LPRCHTKAILQTLGPDVGRSGRPLGHRGSDGVRGCPGGALWACLGLAENRLGLPGPTSPQKAVVSSSLEYSEVERRPEECMSHEFETSHPYRESDVTAFPPSDSNQSGRRSRKAAPVALSNGTEVCSWVMVQTRSVLRRQMVERSHMPTCVPSVMVPPTR